MECSKMADVTFGVKVPEEMKGELSEIMKNTQLSGKEFMSLLLTSYKLEQNKQNQKMQTSEIDELQRLLQRIQHIYMNMNERSALVKEEELRIQEERVQEKDEAIALLNTQIEDLKKAMGDQALSYKKLEDKIKEQDNLLLAHDESVVEYKTQIQQQRALSQKYEETICGLKERIDLLERLEMEIAERNEENQKLQTRNDDLASEVWFLQREKEKIELEKTTELEKKEEIINKLQERYELEQKNSLLEQKLIFSQKIDLLKEEHYRMQQVLNDKLQEVLQNKNIPITKE